MYHKESADMNKQEYLKLDYPDRVQWLNKQLENLTIEKIAQVLQIRKSNLIVPLQNQGYAFEDNQFVLEKKDIIEDTKDTSDTIIQILERLERLEAIVSPKIQEVQKDTIDIYIPESEEGMMSSRVNLEVMRQWREFTHSRREKAKDLFSMALWEFMMKHR